MGLIMGSENSDWTRQNGAIGLGQWELLIDSSIWPNVEVRLKETRKRLKTVVWKT